jgi:hypothetical protein
MEYRMRKDFTLLMVLVCPAAFQIVAIVQQMEWSCTAQIASFHIWPFVQMIHTLTLLVLTRARVNARHAQAAVLSVL